MSIKILSFSNKHWLTEIKVYFAFYGPIWQTVIALPGKYFCPDQERQNHAQLSFSARSFLTLAFKCKLIVDFSKRVCVSLSQKVRSHKLNPSLYKEGKSKKWYFHSGHPLQFHSKGIWRAIIKKKWQKYWNYKGDTVKAGRWNMRNRWQRQRVQITSLILI